MDEFNFYRYKDNLPAGPHPANSFLLVLSGGAFTLYCTDSVGTAYPHNTGSGSSNTVTSYRSSFEISDLKVYAGYLLNGTPIITRTSDGVIEFAQTLTDLETDWSNRLALTYI
jgi:hypothetical protein